MTQRTLARPELLEDRTVPTGFGAGTGLANLIGSLPVHDAQEVRQAFTAFQATYLQDVHALLPPAGSAVATVPRAVFDASVGTALGTLNTTIDKDVANLPSASTLDTTIQAEILGTAATSLQAKLAAIPTPTSVTAATIRSFNLASIRAVNQTAGQVTQQVAAAAPPAGAVTLAEVTADFDTIESAFNTFSTSYHTAVRTTLLATGTTPAANRAAFNTAVATALTTLNRSIDAALTNLPASVTTPLEVTLTNDLLTGTATTGQSLQARLAAIPTPAGTTGLSPFLFNLRSYFDVAFADGQVASDLVIAVRNYNLGLTS